jgi:hypothetical protein
VLAIAATGESGSTLLTRMLGQLPGFVAIGELGRLWDKGIEDDTPCGCGEPFHACPFWTAVGEDAFGGWDRLDTRRALELREIITRNRSHFTLPRAFPLHVRPNLSRAYAAAEREYLELLRPLYAAVQRRSGARVIVDSMKEPSHVFALTRLDTIDLRVVHHVRDSRGVAYSNVRRVPKQGGAPGAMRKRSRPANTAARWMWSNLAYAVLPALGTPTLRTRYDDIVTRPEHELRRIASFMDAPIADGDLAFLADGSAALPPDHLVAGNRLRLQSGPLRLRVDDEWRHGLRPRDRALVSAITWPLMRTYSQRGDEVANES